MRIHVTFDSANESELRAILLAHKQIVRDNVAGEQPVTLGSKSGGAVVRIEGPHCYTIESNPLTLLGVDHILSALRHEQGNW